MKYTITDLETDRLKFRPFVESDLDAWLPFFEDRSIWKFLCLDRSKSIHEINQFWMDKCQSRYRENRGGLMAVIDKNTHQLLGMCGLLVQNIDGKKRLEVGYSFLPDSRGKGYASEAAQFAKNYGFEQGYDRDFDNAIVSMIHHENKSSMAVALRNELTLEKETVIELGEPFFIYSIKRSKWETTA
jgi:RimJ/RimL family protein N-acetyltransferase